MERAQQIVKAVRQALRSEPRIKLDRYPILLSFADGDLVMEGELPDIAAKKLALERGAGIRSVDHIVDRLRVVPAERMGNGQIRDAVCKALMGEPALESCALRQYVKGKWETIRMPIQAAGVIDFRVDGGVVTLAGDVPGLPHKRLAGVLAWWVPGSRDVVNGLAVTPPEEDNDEEIADTVRLVLEKDPFVNASQIHIGARNSVVTLAGLVPSETERQMAEYDAWYVFGVDNVVNRIAVRA
jgi:osmotically-inducible protein OsmY